MPSGDSTFGATAPEPHIASLVAPGTRVPASRGLDDNQFSQVLDHARHLEERSLSLLYERYLPVVYRFILLRVGDTHQAEDLTSDVFYQVVTHIGQLRAEDELTFAAWILRIARNVVTAHYRRSLAQPPTEPVEEMRLDLATSAEEGDPLAIITAREDWSEVVAALALLTEEQRTVILYRCLFDYSADEVGQLMGKRAGTIRALQFRALASLTRLLERAAASDTGGRIPILAAWRRRRIHGSE